MAFTEQQLKKVPPTARKVARLTGELDSILARLKEQTVYLSGREPSPEGIHEVTGSEVVAQGERQIIGDLGSVAKRLRNLISDLKVLDDRSDGLVEVRKTVVEWQSGTLRDNEEGPEENLLLLETFVEGATVYPKDRPLGSQKIIA